MRAILQTKRTVGSRKPYKREEWIRIVDKGGGYAEIESPARDKNGISKPERYFSFYLINGQDYALAFAYPFEGFNEFIESILRNDGYEKAFRQEWPRFDNMLITNQKKLLSESAKRPILGSVQDPEDGFKRKWVVASQIMVSAQDSDDVQNAKILKVLESLVEPTLGLHIEATDARDRVLTGVVDGRYRFPKSGFDKFMETYMKPYIEIYNEVEPILDIVKYIIGK